MERKLATVLFVDLVGSTELVSSADPEVVRRRVTEYFARAARCIEQHGGTVEKFAGDAVMAVFGVPRAHEDDAERAVRAAVAVLDAVHELGLEARTGIEAGEVLVDDGDSSFVTGEAVNIAARLQQAAQPGEILLGPGVRRLAARGIEVDDAGPIELPGIERSLWTWRVRRVVEGGGRLQAAPFVGREEELELLENAFARAVRDRRAHLVTVFGEPGIGKSRLVAEFVDGLERATVLSGRALPYGEGVTYWPLAAMIKASAGIRDDDAASEAFEKLRHCCESEAVAELLAAALGVLGAAEEGRSGRELQWAARVWAEQLAEGQPLVLVFEDVHWAEEPLLDVVENLADALRTVPVLLVCVARPELLECRPAWGGGNTRALALELAPLPHEESAELADALLSHTSVPPARRALLLEKAEGNPLFLEETVRMLADAEAGETAPERIPDTVQALIAARIDRLEPDAKRLLQRAALVGRIFWRGALDRLEQDGPVGRLLDTLLDHELVVPEERSSISGDRAFRFKHGLIRDVAYSGLTKAQRADDHRAFAGWIAERAPDELAEIRAYHLQHAAGLLEELEGAVPEELAAEAAAALEQAGARALNRESYANARRLLARSAELEPTLWRRYLAARAAWLTSDPAAEDELSELAQSARSAGDRRVEGRALLGLALAAVYGAGDVPKAARLAEEALAVIEPEDERSRYEALSVLQLIAWWRGRLAEGAERLEEMAAIARRLGRNELEAYALSNLGSVKSEQGDPDAARALADEAIAAAERCGTIEARARALATVGQVQSRHGSFDEAVGAFEESAALYEQVGAAAEAAWMLTRLGRMRLGTGDVESAEREARLALRLLTGVPAAGRLVEARRLLAEVRLAQGRVDEAERQALAAADVVSAQDVWSKAGTLGTLGAVRAAQGQDEEAARLVRAGLELAAETEYVFLRRDLEERLAEVQQGAAAS